MRTLLVALSFTLAAPAAMAEDFALGDAEAGESVFRRCAACHAVGPDASNKVGPVLNGAVGRAIASYPDYNYGAGLVALGETGAVWEAGAMAQYILNPAGYVEEVLGERKQAKMAAQRLKDDQLADVIAYIATFDAEGATAE